MSKKEKLIDRFLDIPSDFRYEEIVTLLKYFGFKEKKKGQSSGSRVKFQNNEGIPILLHKPHQRGIMKRYQLRQIREILGI